MVECSFITKWLWVRVQLQSLKTSDFAPASSKEFLDIQATIECGFTLKRVRDIIRTYSQYNHMNVLANENELLKYIEIWNKIEALFNKKVNKKRLYNKPMYNNEYIKTIISSYNENFHDFKKLTKDKY